MSDTGDLQSIPGVGPSIAADLRDLGLTSVSMVAGQDPEDLYERLCTLRGAHIDRCVLYVFRCAVYFASNRKHAPELLKWWNWKDLPPREARSRRPGHGSAC
jgi:hypothetical protein